jgi:3-isopropylmalate dehydrogenase
MLRYSLKLEDEARLVEQAVEDVIDEGLRTPDIASGGKSIGTVAMADAVIAGIETIHAGAQRGRSRS